MGMPQRNSITDIWQCATCNVQSHSYANVLAHEIKSHHGRHAYAVEVKEILPQEDECPCFEPMDPSLPDGTQRSSGLQAGGLEGSA